MQKTSRGALQVGSNRLRASLLLVLAAFIVPLLLASHHPAPRAEAAKREVLLHYKGGPDYCGADTGLCYAAFDAERPDLEAKEYYFEYFGPTYVPEYTCQLWKWNFANGEAAPEIRRDGYYRWKFTHDQLFGALHGTSIFLTSEWCKSAAEWEFEVILYSGPPRDLHVLSGRLTEAVCTEVNCTDAPLSGVTVIADRGDRSTESKTDTEGRYSFNLGSGTYLVSPESDLRFDPESRIVRLKADTSGVDFVHCAEPTGGDARATPRPSECKKRLLVGHVTDVWKNASDNFCLLITGRAGKSYHAVTNRQGFYAVELPKGKYTVTSNYFYPDVRPCQFQSDLTPLRVPVTVKKPKTTLELRSTLTVATEIEFNGRQMWVDVHSPPPGKYTARVIFDGPAADVPCVEEFLVDGQRRGSRITFTAPDTGFVAIERYCSGSYRVFVDQAATHRTLLSCELVALRDHVTGAQPETEAADLPVCPRRRTFGTPQG